MTDERDIVDRLMDYDTCNDAEVDEAAQEIISLRTQLDAAGDGDTWREACKRLEREVAELKLRLSCEEVSHSHTSTMLNKYRFELMAERDSYRTELTAIRDTIHTLNPMLSDGPLPYRVRQLCDDLVATRRERDAAQGEVERLNFDLCQCRMELAAAREIANRLGTERDEARTQLAEAEKLERDYQEVRDRLDAANAQLARGVAHAQERVGLVGDNATLRGLLREARVCYEHGDTVFAVIVCGEYCEEAKLLKIRPEWYANTTAALEGKP